MTSDSLPMSQPNLTTPKRRADNWLAVALREVRHHRGGLIGLALLAFILILTIGAPLFTPYDPIAIRSGPPLTAPNAEHFFGTDPFGRDLYTRVLYGGRISLRLGVIAVLIAATSGSILGLLSGFYGSWVDHVIMRCIDVLLAFPGILLALIIIYVIGPGMTNAMIAVGISAIPRYTRLIRGSVLSAREEVYVEAARVVGCRDNGIMFRHILPNVVGPVIVLSTLSLASAILIASGLSFLGLGASPPTPEWGVMLAEGRDHLRQAWWLTTFPGVAIMITVLGMNLFGDALRDAFDPRLHGQHGHT
jgi:peptide/nickel transport system permease protein